MTFGDLESKLRNFIISSFQERIDNLKDKISNLPICGEIEKDIWLEELAELEQKIKETSPGELNEKQKSYLAGMEYYLEEPADLIGASETKIKELLLEV